MRSWRCSPIHCRRCRRDGAFSWWQATASWSGGVSRRGAPFWPPPASDGAATSVRRCAAGRRGHAGLPGTLWRSVSCSPSPPSPSSRKCRIWSVRSPCAVSESRGAASLPGTMSLGIGGRHRAPARVSSARSRGSGRRATTPLCVDGKEAVWLAERACAAERGGLIALTRSLPPTARRAGSTMRCARHAPRRPRRDRIPASPRVCASASRFYESGKSYRTP